MTAAMASIRSFLLVVVIALAALPARGAEALYPPGSRIGPTPSSTGR
jgi:hypothetical protein